MKQYSAVALLALLAGPAVAQTVPAVQWARTVGSTGNESFKDIQPTADGGYVAVGTTNGNNGNVTGYHGGGDIWAVKFNAAGTVQWQRALGGSSAEMPYLIKTTADGGSIIMGETQSANGDVTGQHGGYDIWIVKLDASGGLTWQRACGGSGDDHNWFPFLQYGEVLVETSDGGFAFTTSSESSDGDVTGQHGAYDMWVVKMDANGQLLWQRSLGGSAGEDGTSLKATDDGGCIVAGRTYSNDGDVIGFHGGSDMWVVRLDGSGTLLWQHALGGTALEDSYDIQRTTDGGCVVVGISNSSEGDVVGGHDLDIWVVKLDGNGALQWQRPTGGFSQELTPWVRQTADSGYIITGLTASADGLDVSGHHGGTSFEDIWVVRLDASGSFVWQRCLGGTDDDVANMFQPTDDGGCLVAGYEDSVDGGNVSGSHGSGDAWLVKLSASGALDWQLPMGGSDADDLSALRLTTDGGFIVAGNTWSTDGDIASDHGGSDAWVVKFGGLFNGVITNTAVTDLSIGPVPAQDEIRITTGHLLSQATIGLVDACGQQVRTARLVGTTLKLSVADLPRGLYMVTLTSPEGVRTQRIMLQ